MTPTTMPAQMPKKFSTAIRIATSILCGFALLDQGLALAQSSGSDMPADMSAAPAKAKRQKLPANATQISDTQAVVGNDVFVPDAPNRHLVVKGDTLWDISAKYLKKPWLWPQIWNMNRDQIRNPHWIYPGQIIYLDKLRGTMSLTPPLEDNTVVLQPSVRVSNDLDGIASIPQNIIEPFLTRPLIVDNETMNKAPRIIAGQERIAMATGDIAYASGIGKNYSGTYHIYRPGTPVTDPDTGEVIGFQADDVGIADLLRKGDPATIVIKSFRQEVSVGDRLAPQEAGKLINYAPHAPDRAIHGRVVLVYGGVSYAGRNMVIAINRGSKDGLEIGHILEAQTLGANIVDTTNGKRRKVKLPDERNGQMFVFRVFDRISYALLLNVERPVVVGDVVTEP